MERWFKGVQKVTERYLTWRKRRKLEKKEKHKKRHVVIEWIDAFLWAALVVLLINQYFFQAYQIPSGSMERTLMINDRIFVNKLIYGPELIPGMLKMPGLTEPKRSSIIIFENPTYLSKGPIFDIVQRVLYMLTLSLVNIDRGPNGKPRAHFLIKRAIGVQGDRIRIREGSVQRRPAGVADWVPEMQLHQMDTSSYKTQRLLQPSDYPAIHASAIVDAWDSRGLVPDPAESKILKNTANAVNLQYEDQYEWSAYRNMALHQILPQSSRYRTEYQRFVLGWYIPNGFIFPMGDNRDDSNDARYFGPVHLSKVLGKAMFIYWPLSRIGVPRW